MNRIDEKFRELKRKGKKAFIAFVTAGDPSLGVTRRLVLELEKNGSDIIELGIPFSDPLADGPTIQRSSERALRRKVNIDSVCGVVRDIRKKTQIPIVFLTYYNLISHYGLRRFVYNAERSGVDGVVIPDLPPEESGELRAAAKRRDFAVIHLAAPTSSDERIRRIVESSTGFIYYVSLTGTTGERVRLPGEICKRLKRIKRMTKKPVCVGFGISKPGQVREISRMADGVIVGSAVMKVIERNLGGKNMVGKAGKLVFKLASSRS